MVQLEESRLTLHIPPRDHMDVIGYQHVRVNRHAMQSRGLRQSRQEAVPVTVVRKDGRAVVALLT